MKKKIAVFATLALMVSLAGCQYPWVKKSDKTKKSNYQKIYATKVRESMKGKKLVVGVSKEIAPFSFYSEDEQKMVGFDIDLIERISRYLGFEYTLKVAPMKELTRMLKDKTIDCAIAGICITDERQKEFSFTDSYFENTIKILVNQESGISDRRNMKGKKIGVETGTSNESYAKDYLSEQNTIITYQSMSGIFSDLESGKLDATIYDTTGIDYYLDHHPVTVLKALDEELNSDESNYGIMFRKNNQYVDEFNVALQVLSFDGVLQKLQNQWIGTDENAQE